MIYRAIVADNRDPAQQGRLKVMIPATSGSSISDWIWPILSSWSLDLPNAGDQVWVAFENGDRDVPVWLGSTIERLAEDLHKRVYGDGVGRIARLTQAEYDAITPDEETLYVIVG